MSDDARHLRLHPEHGAAGPPERGDPASSTPDELDALLREWHQANATRAAAGRDRLMASLRAAPTATNAQIAASNPWSITVRRIGLRALVPLAAAAAVALVVIPLLRTTPPGTGGFSSSAHAAPATVLALDGGRLDALTPEGQPLGPLELQHTDVSAAITGAFARVTLTQHYRNPHPQPIDARFTVPLRAGGAVDELRLTIGSRVVLGEIVAADDATAAVELARSAGETAGLVEQSRPSVFSQSIVNLEPGQPVEVRISYVEPLTREADGDWSFTFPATLTPHTSGPGSSAAANTADRPATRPAGDLSLRLHLDTGGPGVLALSTPGYPTRRQDTLLRTDGLATRCVVALEHSAAQSTSPLPNQDFTLRWRLALPGIPVAAFTERADTGDFLGLVISVPNQVDSRLVLPRDLTFAYTPMRDGDPPAAGLINSLLARLHPQDRFNLVAAAGDGSTTSPWSASRAVTPDSRSAAAGWLQAQAARPLQRLTDPSQLADALAATALVTPPADPAPVLTTAELAATPADDRLVTVRVPDDELDVNGLAADGQAREAALVLSPAADTDPSNTHDRIRIDGLTLPRSYLRRAAENVTVPVEIALIITGRLRTIDGHPVLLVERVELADAPAVFVRRALIAIAPPTVDPDTLSGELTRRLPEHQVIVLAEPADAPQAQAAADRLASQLDSTVLTDLRITPSASLANVRFEPPLTEPISLDATRPLTILGRADELSAGQITLEAQLLSGPWRVTVPIAPPNAVSPSPIASLPTDPPPGPLPSLWAQAHITRLAAERDRVANDDPAAAALITGQLVAAASQFGLVTPHTSLLAIDHRRVLVDGQPVLAPVPQPMADAWSTLLVASSPSGSAPSPSHGARAAAATPQPPVARAIGRIFALASHTSKAAVVHSDLASPLSGPSTAGSTKLNAQAGGKLAQPAFQDGAAAKSESTPPAATSPSVDSVTETATRPGERKIAAPTTASSTSDDDSATQNLRADQYFATIDQQLRAFEQVGLPPRERLAAAAAANFVTQSALEGQLITAQRGQQLFQDRFPDSPLLLEVAAALASDPAATRDQLRAESRETSKQRGSPAERSGKSALAASPPPADDAQAAAGAARNQPQPAEGVQQVAQRVSQALERETELSRRLDPRLYQRLHEPLLVGNADSGLNARSQRQQTRWHTQQSVNSQAPVQSRSYANSAFNRVAIETAPGELIVSVLVESLDEPTLAALRAAGLRVQSTLPDSPVVVGILTPATLEPVALVPGVKRIEPATLDAP